jgi:HEAT repeat protein
MGLPPTDPKLAELYQQIEIIGETMLPYEIWHRLKNVGLSKSDQDSMLFKRKLEAIAKLGDLRDERAVKTLVAIIEDQIFGVKRLDPQQKLLLQQEAVAALGKIGGPVALAKLNDLLNSKDPKERIMASRGYSGAAAGQAVTDLLAALKNEKDAGIKSQIISALGKIGSGSSSNQEKELIVKELIREMENNTGEVPLAAINALGEIKLKSATEALLNQLKAHLSIERLVQDAVRALGEIGDDRAVELLVIILQKHGSKIVRSAAAVALGKIGGSKALAALKSSLSTEKEPSVKADISAAIHRKPAILHWTFQ